MILSRKHNLFLIVWIIISSNSVFAQDHLILDRFDIYKGETKVYLSCTISAGSICNGISIYRSEDTTQGFDKIGEIPSFCGNNSSPVSYEFIDNYPVLNKPSYYKLELGTYGFTKVKSILINDYGDAGFQVRPNPATASTYIYFENNFSQEIMLYLFDNFGNNIITEISKGNNIYVDLSLLKAGIYYFKLVNKTTLNQQFGKIFVKQ